jgi:hypothetical protein
MMQSASTHPSHLRPSGPHAVQQTCNVRNTYRVSQKTLWHGLSVVKHRVPRGFSAFCLWTCPSTFTVWHLRKNQQQLTISANILKYFGSHRPWSPHDTNKEPRVFFELCPCLYFGSTYHTRSRNGERQFETWELLVRLRPLSWWLSCTACTDR